MDCKTARLLLDYARAASAELDAEEARALDEHLAACESCDQLARAERRADEAVGKAMRQVDVPDQLRARILARLKEERGDERGRWIAYGLRAAIAAAAVLLLGLGLWRWFMVRPTFPAVEQVNQANLWVIGTPDARTVEAALKEKGVAVTAPPELDYSRLRWLFLANVKGRQTPLLIFHNAEGGGGSQHALVFLVSDGQFDLNDLPRDPQLNNAYEYKCATHVPANGGERVGYVIYYTGNDLRWLVPPPEIPTTGVGN